MPRQETKEADCQIAVDRGLATLIVEALDRLNHLTVDERIEYLDRAFRGVDDASMCDDMLYVMERVKQKQRRLNDY